MYEKSSPAGANRRSRKKKSLYQRMRGPLAVGLLLLLAIAAWVLATGQTGRPPASMPVATVAGSAGTSGNGAELVRLPADDAAHGTATEWWYYNGHLRSASGQRYGYHVTAFRREQYALYSMFHVSLVDLQTGKHYSAQARTAGVPATPKQDGFAFNYLGWQLTGSGEKHTLRVSTKEFTLALDLEDSHGPTLHQVPGKMGPGLVDFGEAGQSYYYSRMRMATRGSLTLSGVERPVSGQSWFDHQWGDFESTALTWNWFALQLDDGADIMLFQVVDAQGKLVNRFGSIGRDGKTTLLGAGDIRLTPRRHWSSPANGVNYPVQWDIALPGEKMALTVQPFVDNCEFNGLETVMRIYWEGPVQVSGTHRGIGYLELSGYRRNP